MEYHKGFCFPWSICTCRSTHCGDVHGTDVAFPCGTWCSFEKFHCNSDRSLLNTSCKSYGFPLCEENRGKFHQSLVKTWEFWIVWHVVCHVCHRKLIASPATGRKLPSPRPCAKHRLQQIVASRTISHILDPSWSSWFISQFQTKVGWQRGKVKERSHDFFLRSQVRICKLWLLKCIASSSAVSIYKCRQTFRFVELARLSPSAYGGLSPWQSISNPDFPGVLIDLLLSQCMDCLGKW